MQIATIIQARMGSTRLPGKVLMTIKGRPVLEHICNRLTNSKYGKDIIIATTDLPGDVPITEFCRDRKIPFYCGDENNLIARYYEAALQVKAEVIVRVTGDCPLVDPDCLDQSVDYQLKYGSDYVMVDRLPKGFPSEVLSIKALALAKEKAKESYDKEHLIPFIVNHPDLFKVAFLPPPPFFDRPKMRFTLDTTEDYQFISRIYDRLYDGKHILNNRSAIELVEKDAELRQTHRHLVEKLGV